MTSLMIITEYMKLWRRCVQYLMCIGRTLILILCT